MLVVYANDEIKDTAYDWDGYALKDHKAAAIFRNGATAVFERSRQRIDEVRKMVASRQLRGRDIVVNM